MVQKHAARRLHYDFRLELDGVLKSWAVTRGPSLDPADRRLAVHVEDHPVEYAGFEGIIPAGEYGGGTVMVWDRGTWEPIDDPREGYARGKLKFRLHGQKLRGGWTLVRMGGRARAEKRDNWLLIKERDEEARPGEGERLLEEADRSALSGRTMAEIAAARERVWHSDRTAPAPAAGRTRPRRAPPPPAVEDVAGAVPGTLPDFVEPQLPALQDRPPAGDVWLHEIKLDGYRMLCRIAGGGRGRVRLLTRTGLDWTDRFAGLARAAARLGARAALIDGEVVATDAAGITSFAALQRALGKGDTAAVAYYAFDLLHLDGRDLTGAPLEARKQVLRALLAAAPDGPIRFSDHEIGQGAAVMDAACRLGLEGIVSKRRDAPYRPGRSRLWIKCKCTGRDEFVIAGFLVSTVDRRAIGSLALGAHRDGSLVYVGRVGTGFDADTSRGLYERLSPLERRTPPFATALPAAARRGVRWVEPRLVCAIEFRGWTGDGLLRHASFVGLREDKPAAEVSVPGGPRPRRRAGAAAAAEAAEIAGVRLTHPDRVLVAGSGLTKRGLAEFYAEIADWVLPEVRGRALSLVRCPEGGDGPCFYHKHAAAGWPGAIHRVEVNPDEPPYMWIDDLAGLVGLVQMSAVELHPWGSRVRDLDRPDRLVFDLDPAPDVPWERVITAAVECRTRLEGLGLRSFVKTTGGKGLHVVVPLAPRQGWGEVKAFARAFAERLARDSAGAYTATMSKAARRGRIFIDYLRNDRGATAVAAYTVRARPNAPVATPLAWDELSPALRSDHFTVTTLPRRLARLGRDPWAEMATLRQSVGARARRALGLP